MRVASLTPSNTEILAFLDELDALVARDDFSDWPPGVGRVETLGPDLQIDVDRLVEIDPDLVLAAESVPGMQRVNERLAARDLDHLVLAPTSLEEIAEDIERVARALDVEGHGRRLAERMRSAIDEISDLTRERQPREVYWEWWPDPPIAPGAGGWTDEVIARAGGRNVFGDREVQSLETSLSEVRERDPDVVALCWQGTLHSKQSVERFVDRDEGAWGRLRAAREGRVLTRPEELHGRPGPRVVEGLRQLAGLLHPEIEDELPEPYAWVPDALKDRLPL